MGTDGAISRGRCVRGMDSSARSGGGIKSTRIFGGNDGLGKRMKRYACVVCVCARERERENAFFRVSYRVYTVVFSNGVMGDDGLTMDARVREPTSAI
jgi:hypothetical protein